MDEMSFSYAELSQRLKNTIPVTVHTSERAPKRALPELLQQAAKAAGIPIQLTPKAVNAIIIPVKIV